MEARSGKVQAVLFTQMIVSLSFLPVSLVALKIIAKKEDVPGIRETLRVPFGESKQYMGQGLIITADKTIGNFFPQSLFFVFSLFVPAATVGVAIEMKLTEKGFFIYELILGVLSTAYIFARPWLDFETYELRFSQLLAVLTLLGTIVYVVVQRKRYPYL
jgi:hypothetical protein